MTVRIGNKEYKTVAERLNEFHSHFKGKEFNIITQVIDSHRESHVRMRATIQIKDGGEMLQEFTGHAEEDYEGNFINKTSALEVCETSAIGRALASAGYGGEEFASAEEVANAIQMQNRNHPYSDTAITSKLASNDKPLSQETVNRAKKNLLSAKWSTENRDKVIKFGKHKGTKWSELDGNYVNWLAQNSDNDTVKSFAVDEMHHRTHRTEVAMTSSSVSQVDKLQALADKVVSKGIENSKNSNDKADEIIDAIRREDEKIGEENRQKAEEKETEELPF